MTILFLILKIIGFILLILLALFFLFILLLLFVPVRYRMSANMESDIQIKGGISWLLHLVALTGVYKNGKFLLKLRVLFFSKLIMDTAQAKNITSERAEEAEESLKSAAEEITDDSKLWEIPEDELTSGSDEPGIGGNESPTDSGKPTTDSARSAECGDESISGDEDEQATNTQGKACRKKGIPVVIQLAQDFIHRAHELRMDAENVFNKIKSISDDSKCRSALVHLKEELFLLFKMLWPRRMRINIRFSAGTPDKTGQILGVCAMFPITYSKGNVLVPDFETERAYAKGQADLKGRVYLYQIVGIAIRVIFDKNCRRLLHRIQALRT